MEQTLEMYIRNKISEQEQNHQYEVATDTIRCWLDLYYGFESQKPYGRDTLIVDLAQNYMLSIVLEQAIRRNVEKFGKKIHEIKISDFGRFSENELLKMPRIGSKCMREIKLICRIAGVDLIP